MWQPTMPVSCVTKGYISQKGMQRLVEDNLIQEVKNVQFEKCIDCLAYKKNRTSFRMRPPMRRKALRIRFVSLYSATTESSD